MLPRPSRDELRKLAETNPQSLVDWMKRQDPGHLTYAAEILGELSPDKDLARRELLPLASHKSALVREGAVYGLSNFLGDNEVRECLSRLSRSDPSPSVREAAEDALDLEGQDGGG